MRHRRVAARRRGVRLRHRRVAARRRGVRLRHRDCLRDRDAAVGGVRLRGRWVLLLLPVLLLLLPVLRPVRRRRLSVGRRRVGCGLVLRLELLLRRARRARRGRSGGDKYWHFHHAVGFAAVSRQRIPARGGGGGSWK